MRVLKIAAEGITTSFRYPHFMHGVQPTFEVPPPATVYGHICSAVGDWVDPEGLEFAYHFTFKGRFDDVEHTHLVSRSGGRLPGSGIPKVMEGEMIPFKRGILFAPRLVLYINRPEWVQSFRSPRYPVALGRSQDLFTYRDVAVIELERASRAYFEHTLAPYRFAFQAGRGYSVLLPRFIDYNKGRRPQFARYHILDRRVYSDQLVQVTDSPDGSGPATYWVDPGSKEERGARLGLFFHSFTGEYDDRPLVAGMD